MPANLDFEKDLPTGELLFAFNNNVLRFHSTVTTKTVAYAVITFNTYTRRLFPSPLGWFYFNMKDWVLSLMQSNDFADDLNVSLLPGDPASHIYDWTNRVLVQGKFHFEIFYTDTTTDVQERDWTWLSAYYNLEDWKLSSTPFNEPVFPVTSMFALHPENIFGNKQPYAKMWRGYPFDLTCYTPDTDTIAAFLNGDTFDPDTGTGIYAFALGTGNKVNRFVFSNGANDNDITQETLTMISGKINNLILLVGDLSGEGEVFDVQEWLFAYDAEPCHGVYFKFINSMGGWSYWLFTPGKRTRTTKDLGELENDFNDVQDTISPTVSIGVEAYDTLEVFSDTVDKNEMLLLAELMESPKIYLFTGHPGVPSNYLNWIEVNLQNKNAVIRQAKNKQNQLTWQFKLPPRNTRTL